MIYQATSTAVSKLIIVNIYVCTLAESILCVHANDQLILGSPRCWWSHFKNYIWNINTTLLLPFVSFCVTICKIIRNHLLSQKIISCKWKTCFESIMPTNLELFSVSKLTKIASPWLLNRLHCNLSQLDCKRHYLSVTGIHMKRGTQCGVKFVELIDNASKHAFLPITLQVSTELVKCSLLDHTLPRLL